MACEAAGAVRTVQSLTREEEAFQEYSRSLDGPLKKSNRTAFFSTGLFALSQALSFFVIALVCKQLPFGLALELTSDAYRSSGTALASSLLLNTAPSSSSSA